MNVWSECVNRFLCKENQWSNKIYLYYNVKPAYGEFLDNETLFHQALFQYTDT